MARLFKNPAGPMTNQAPALCEMCIRDRFIGDVFLHYRLMNLRLGHDKQIVRPAGVENIVDKEALSATDVVVDFDLGVQVRHRDERPFARIVIHDNRRCKLAV